eukprot:852648-Rhodomonas_salina.1
MEVLRQDLLRAGHTEAIADACIVTKLLKTLVSTPDAAPHASHLKFVSMTWKIDHSKTNAM